MTVLDDFRASFDARVQAPPRARPQRPPVLTTLARLLGTLAAVVLGAVRRGRGDLLTIGALACGVAGAFRLSVTIGLFGLMAAGLILEWATRSD